MTKTWSSMQATVAQSSGDAEYYAMVRAAAEALGVQSIMRDLGWEANIRLWVDSSAAKSMASRIGVGKVRHMEVKFLWLQEAVKNRGIEVRKIPGDVNPADVLTKPKSVKDVAVLLEPVGVRIRGRREDGPSGDGWPGVERVQGLAALPWESRLPPRLQHGAAGRPLRDEPLVTKASYVGLQRRTPRFCASCREEERNHRFGQLGWRIASMTDSSRQDGESPPSGVRRWKICIHTH